MKSRLFTVSGLTVIILTASFVLALNLARAAKESERVSENVDAVQQQAQNVELVGQIGGPTNAVAVQGSYAYVGVGPRLVILNISDPAQPAVVGQTAPLPGTILDIAVMGTYAYITYKEGKGSFEPPGEGGLSIVDVSDVTAPIEVGFYDRLGSPTAVVVVDHYAYIADWTFLRIIDVANPAVPIEVGYSFVPSLAIDVAVVGRYAYVTAFFSFSSGLRIIDVANPATPVDVGFYETPTAALGVAIVGNYAYVTTRDGLHILDVADPTAPTPAGFYEMPTEYVGDVAVAGRYAYVARANGLHILDVTNPAVSAEVGFYAVSGRVAVVGRYAYLAAGEGGLRILDVADPTTLTEVGFYDTPGEVQTVAVAGRYASVVANDGLHILDVSNSAVPIEVGAYTYVSARELTAVERYVYLAAGDGLHILDVADPTAPTEVGFYDMPGEVQTVAVAGRYAYLATNDGLRIVDVADPAAPTETGFYAGFARAVTVAEHYAYIAGRGLRIIDVSNPAAPTEIGYYDTPGSAVAVAGSYAYVAGGSSGLRIVDISDPAHPAEVGFYDAPGYGSAHDVAVAGRYVYVADRDSLRVLDVSNPAAPIQVGFYTTPGWAQGVALADNFTYIADGAGGLLILGFRLAPISVSIPTTGGSLTSPFDGTTYTFAAGTFTDTVTIIHTPRFSGSVPSTGRLVGINHFFEVSAVYGSAGQPAQPTQPYTVTVEYTDAEKGPAIERTLALYYWDGAQWVREPTRGVDPDTNTVTATPDRFGLWAVLGETHRMFLPVVLRNQ